MMKTINHITAVLIMSIVVLLSSCSEHSELDHVDTSKKVGNILLSTNRIISPNGYDSSTMEAVGVIFGVVGDTAYAVAKDDLGKYIYCDTLYTVSNVTNDMTTLCGNENTAALFVSGENVPAALAAIEYRSPLSNWVLPSAGELLLLARNIGIVSDVMRQIGGDPFYEEQYVSSSQDGSSSENSSICYYSVSVTTGRILSTLKTTAGRVRPVLRLN